MKTHKNGSSEEFGFSVWHYIALYDSEMVDVCSWISCSMMFADCIYGCCATNRWHALAGCKKYFSLTTNVYVNSYVKVYANCLFTNAQIQTLSRHVIAQEYRMVCFQSQKIKQQKKKIHKIFLKSATADNCLQWWVLHFAKKKNAQLHAVQSL